MNTDVTIAGLGPAGAIAAWRLALMGYRVRGIDPQRSYIKACGDAVVSHPTYNDILRRSGSIKEKVRNFLISISFKIIKEIKFQEPIWFIIDKKKLVNYLRGTAEAEGAIIEKGVINIKKQSKEYIIDARGPYANPPTSFVFAYRIIAKVDSWNREEVLLNFIPENSGLTWIFPSSRGERFVNIGGGIRNESLTNIRKIIIKNAKKQFGELEVVEEAAAPIAVFSDVKPIDNNIIKIGEAGGFINSAGGEGIRLAMLSGLAAAKAFNYDNPISAYNNLTKQYVKEAVFSRKLLKIINRADPSIASKILDSLPPVFWSEFLRGRLSYSLVIISAFLSPPLVTHVLKALSSSQS